MNGNNPANDTNIDHTGNVKQVQTFLREAALSDNRIPLIAIDGIFGDETEAAVIEFQKLHNLEQSGTVDFESWKLLYSEYDRLLRNKSPYINMKAFSDFIDKDNDTAISFIQVMLKSICRKYADVPEIDINGKIDDNTEKAICAVHKCTLENPDEFELCREKGICREAVDSISLIFNAINL